MNSIRKPPRRLAADTWLDGLWFGFFLFLSIFAIAGLILAPAEDLRADPFLNALLSIGTGGVVSFVFYFVVSNRTERRRRRVVREGNLSAYRVAKHNIAVAILSASQQGGRKDIDVDTDTVDKCLTISGFRALFEGGREADEGFYAFQNEMHNETPEFAEIVLNLRIIETAAERLVLSGVVPDEDVYKRLVSLSHVIRRIESNGAGYDESKRLCQFIWEMFGGWNWRDGQLDRDPIEEAFANA